MNQDKNKPMKSQNISITKIKSNEHNPRFITDDKFKQLVQSIRDFPAMLDLRPIVVDEDMVVLGGNMRLKACIEAGLKEVPIIIAAGLTEEQKKEFIIKDNVGFGEWDYDMLANDFDNGKLVEWGLDVWNGEEETETESLPDRTTHKITLEYSDEQFPKVLEAFNKFEGTKENTVMKLLGL